MKTHALLAVFLLAGGAGRSLAVAAQEVGPLDSALVASFRWRSIGPANMGGRITDVEGIPGPSKTFYVAASTGGIWKTTNNGTTFRSVFNNPRVVAMGDLAIAPSDTNIIWAGTGEEDSRNSISPGGGIFKSTDGGRTWAFKGLKETQVIARIVVRPDNPDVVYVAALGHIWDANPARGLYRTRDGGDTWELVKFVSDRAGFADVAIHPANPDILFASSWERVRGPYFLRSGGPGSALWTSTDGGDTWTEVTGGGFPETEKGRIGIAFAPSNPDIIYALVEAAAREGETERLSGLYRSEDGGRTWERMNRNNSRPFYYSQVRVDPWDPDRVYWSSTPVSFSTDGGRTVGTATNGIHVDHHAMWIDPSDPERFVVGNDGGIAITYDRGGNYQFINIIPLGQFYAVSYGMQVPYRVCGGLQDNGSWCGPSRRRRGVITNDMWFNVGGGDGFYTAQDPDDPNRIYVESQGGNMSRLNVATGERVSLPRPGWREAYRPWQDSIILVRGDTTRPASPEVEARLAEFRRRASADSAAMDLRWNWSTPFFLSPHDSRVFYAGANRVLKSTNRGEGLHPISPDLTTADRLRIQVSTTTTGGITPDVTGAETHSTIVALAESPVTPGLLFAGTDDGNVWMSPDDGGTWTDLTGRFPGVPPKTWVSRIEPSHVDANTFYVAFDNHRENDFTPYVFVTDDAGRSFRSIAAGLPTGGPDYVHVVREDPVNANLLFVGTDVGVYVSLDRGTTWQRFMTDLPAVPVHDLKIHPRAHELIAGTHGRSVWIVDIAPLEQLDRPALVADNFLFDPGTAYEFGEAPVGGGSTGHQVFAGANAPYGAAIWYRLGENARGQVRVVITDAEGDTVQTLRSSGRAGLHRVTWNLTTTPERPPLSPSQKRDSVIQAARITHVLDSLVDAGTLNERMADRIRENMLANNTRGLFRLLGGGAPGGAGGAGGATRRFVERPGESLRSGRSRSGSGPGLDRNQMFRIFRLLRGGRRGGFGRGPQPQPAAPGTYTVHLVIGDTSYARTLTVVDATRPTAAGEMERH